MDSPFLRELDRYDRIFLTGAGGGFDVFTGLPLHHYLRARGKKVWLGSLSFSDLRDGSGSKLKTDFLEVTPSTPGNDEYFPERYLCRWFAERGEEVSVYAYYGSGARTVLRILEELRRTLGFQAIVLVDGGTHPHRGFSGSLFSHGGDAGVRGSFGGAGVHA